MITNKKDMYEFVDKLLIPEGYIRKKETYYKNNKETITIFVLDKSEFSGKFENLVGCFFKSMMEGRNQYPKYYQNNLKFTLQNIVTKSLLVDKVFDLDNNSFDKNEREKYINDLIIKYGLPFLDLISSSDGIIEAVKKYENLFYTIDVKLRKKLKLKSPL